MNRLLTNNIFRFILLVPIQVLILDNINFQGFVNPYLYVLFILLLPFEISGWALLFFSFTTILAYYYIAETNVSYIRRTFKVPGMMGILKFGLLASVFYGTVKAADLAWGLGDIGVGLMAWLNILGILVIFFMAKPAMKALKDYETQKKNNVEDYTFDPEKLGIEKADYWVKRLAKLKNK